MRERTLMLVFLCISVLLDDTAQAALAQSQSKVPSAKVRGWLAALNDSNDVLLVNALELLDEQLFLAEPEVRERLQSIIREPRFGNLIKATNAESRKAAARTLGVMGEAAKELAPQLGGLLKDPDADVREEAARALGAMGDAARVQIVRIADLLKDSDARVREEAARALGAMGGAAKEFAPRIGNLLKDPDARVREEAARALGAIGEPAKELAPQLGDLLKDPDADVRGAAARTLGSIGEAAAEQASRLADLLKNDPDAHVRMIAAGTLGAMGEAAKKRAPQIDDLLRKADSSARFSAVMGSMRKQTAAQKASRLIELLTTMDWTERIFLTTFITSREEIPKEQIPHLINLLKHPDEDVRWVAAGMLKNTGKASEDQVSRIGELLKDPNADVRRKAVEVLGMMGEAAKKQAPRIGELLKDPDADIRREAAEALGAIGEAAKEQAPRLVDLLRGEPNVMARLSAVGALGRMREVSKDQIPFLVSSLEEKEEDVRNRAGDLLMSMAPLDVQDIAAILAMASTDLSKRPNWLLRAYIGGGGEPQVTSILRWVVGRTSSELPKNISIDEARETLRAFADLWMHTEKYPVLRDDLAQQIARVANLASDQWTSTDIELLESHEKNLKAAYPMHAANLRAARDSIERWHRLKNFVWAWAGHITFWVLLLFVYPRSPQVQAVFFWNPWMRTITGFGYVGLLLTWIPLLRRRLLAPFKSQLLADADLDRFLVESYFPDSEVVIQPSGKREPLLVVLPQLRGQVVLEGASGFGKSMFIKYLLRQSKPLAVFLPAERCKDGVLEAIQTKLEGHAKDPAFLQSIIYSGALDIYIDGLNEVTADTRARIVQFLERNFHGNILLATQRMEWTPPTTARVYALQPLFEARMSEFLVSREPLLEEKVRLRGAEYREACQRFVQGHLSPDQPQELRQAMREVLSNPMDLTVIAQMIADGHSPDLFRLRQQQYELMARDYLEVTLAEFPLKEFAEESYRLRLEDRPSLSEERFGKELLRLEAFKMVVRRQWKGPDGQEHREWRFRHDKLQEFFIAQTFLGANNPRIVEHMDDPRFRGVYFLLALLLEPESAKHLRDLLVVRAARTRDHTVSDEFVTLLEVRRGAELAPPKAVASTGT